MKREKSLTLKLVRFMFWMKNLLFVMIGMAYLIIGEQRLLSAMVLILVIWMPIVLWYVQKKIGFPWWKSFNNTWNIIYLISNEQERVTLAEINSHVIAVFWYCLLLSTFSLDKQSVPIILIFCCLLNCTTYYQWFRFEYNIKGSDSIWK